MSFLSLNSKCGKCNKNKCNCHIECNGCGIRNTCYAQYGVNANPPSGSRLPLYEIFSSGETASLSAGETITLKEGFVYLVNYVFLATPEQSGYMQIVPYINNAPQLLYSTLANGGGSRNASVSAGFLTDSALSGPAQLSFSLTYGGAARNIDISGAISITTVSV